MVIVKAGINVSVKGYDGDLVTCKTSELMGLKIEKHSPAEFARARAKVGKTVLFDLRFKQPEPTSAAGSEEVIEVQIGGSGEVEVPFGSNLKVYAGLNIKVQEVHGRVDAFAGLNLSLKDVYLLGNVSAGRTMDLDCQTMSGDKTEYSAGGNLRFYVHDLTSAHIRVRDLGGLWEVKIGGGEKLISLKCGGEATLVTAQKVEPLPPHYVLGKIENPAN